MKTKLALLLLLYPLACHARLVTTRLAWDASAGGKFPLDHYTLYYQTGSGDYRTVTVPATQLSVSLSLQSSTVYKFFATVRDVAGNESSSSNILVYKTRKR